MGKKKTDAPALSKDEIIQTYYRCQISISEAHDALKKQGFKVPEINKWLSERTYG